MPTSLQRLCTHRGMRWEPELREARNYGLSSARNVPVSSIITGWFSTVNGILDCSSCGSLDVKTLIQGLPSNMPIAVPSTPGMAIHSSVFSLSTCSIFFPGTLFPFSISPALLQEEPLRLQVETTAAILSTTIAICLITDKSLLSQPPTHVFTPSHGSACRRAIEHA